MMMKTFFSAKYTVVKNGKTKYERVLGILCLSLIKIGKRIGEVHDQRCFPFYEKHQYLGEMKFPFFRSRGKSCAMKC